MDKQSNKDQERSLDAGQLLKKKALIRGMLSKIADRWTFLVIYVLSVEGELRFTQLLEKSGGISQKMLTQTLRQLERDGLVSRKVHAVVPPRVDYKLTPLGDSLREAVHSLWSWIEGHLSEVESSRQRFDASKNPGVEP